MKLKWKVLRLFLPLLVAGVVVPLVMPGPDGRPVMSLSDWLPERAIMEPVEQLLARLRRVNDSEPATILAPEVVYKWRDEAGMWHFTDDPKSVPAGVVPQALPAVANEMPAPEMSPRPGVPSAGSPGLPGMLDSAKQAKRLTEERNEVIEQL